ncbi:MAG TPA: beta-ketoacyl synthase N-terminal-like domain-containing protein, partial [Chroococcidiopsis sp.]
MPLEPIAIIGIGCRFPGADSPSAFWELLRQGQDAITEVPKSRWDIQQFYDPDLSQPGKANTRWGGFLEAIDQFDPLFFGIAPREAPTMDPQQRLLLEVAWEAFEDAGLVPERLRGSHTGVYIGIGTHDYSIRLWQHPVSDPYATTGTGNCIAANRISYLFDLKGPSLAVDTACSSSLVAVHLACQSLWSGESTLALAGGVNVLLLPNVTAGFSKGGFMSPSGRCKSFDASADGYVRSEGAGVVVLKPLSQAQADGDPIYAVIRATAVNQDGFSHGMAAPNPQAQMAVLRQAYQRAGVNPAQVRYVEAHGTGTKMGDPVELEALGAVLSEGRLAEQPCLIGSVKTNIGHSETAAGVAGLIKLALSLKYGQIPPSLHYQQPTPLLQSATLPLQVNDRLTDWGDRPHIAGVNSFGFGGTNAHVVVEGAPLVEVCPQAQAEDHPKTQTVRPQHLLTLSAKSGAALRSLAQRYQQRLDEQAQWSPADLADLCFSTHARRSHFHHRLAIAATTATELQASLAAVAAGTTATEVPNLSKGVLPQSISPVVFLCTGQGSQAVGMGRQLYDSQPVFRRAIDRCAAILEAYLDVPLLQVIYPDLVPAPTQRAAKS